MNSSHSEQRRKNILGMCLIILSVLIGISLATYSPRDELLMIHHQLIDNQMGIAGVFVSYFLIKMGLGWFAWGLVPLIFTWGLWIILKKETRVMVRSTFYILGTLLVLSIFFSIDMIAENGMKMQSGFIPGGFTGGTLALFLSDWFGVIPAMIILVFCLILLVTGYFRIHTVQLLKRHSQKKKKEHKQQMAVSPPPAETKIGATPVLSTEKEQIQKVAGGELTKKKKTTGEKRHKKKKEILLHPLLDGRKKETGPDLRKSHSAGEFNPSEYQYQLPSYELLNPSRAADVHLEEELRENSELLTRTLSDFNVSGKVIRYVTGPIITRYEVEPDPGVRVSRIASLSDDIARVLAAKHIRIVAPIPGTKVVGVEIPNKKPQLIDFRSVIDSEVFRCSDHLLDLTISKTSEGEPFNISLESMPHLLIAGTTGSGKSVCINTIILSILFRARPDEVKFIMVDPKKIELSIYKVLEPYHLITSEDVDEPVITNQQNAIYVLRSAIVEMESRYDVFQEAEVRNIGEYNVKMKAENKPVMPYVVVLIDELADLMLSSNGKSDMEHCIQRLAQMARAVGIHLVFATQRPSVDVITGVIRANFPGRIAFNVATKTDSRTILDANGAETLLGNGDMLFITPGSSSPVRLHNAYVSLREIKQVLEHIKHQQPLNDKKQLPGTKYNENDESGIDSTGQGVRDNKFDQAMELAIMHKQASASFFQRRLKIGFSRAGRILDELEEAGIVGPPSGSKAREVLVGPEYLEHLSSLTNESYDEEL